MGCFFGGWGSGWGRRSLLPKIYNALRKKIMNTGNLTDKNKIRDANMSLPFDDQPIQKPAEDRYEVNSFAKAIAKCILNIQSPNGTVIALNGPWGIGKSSAVNLARCHMQSDVTKGDLKIVDFSCWWFRGEEDLAIAFFRELYAALNPELGERAKNSLTKLASRLLNTGPLLGKIADASGAGGFGEVGGMAADWLGRLIQVDESVEALFSDLKKLLEQQQKKFLIIIDDIDRLSPDEAILMFRLVKSVGQLPNVIYLLVYDRVLAEKVTSEKFPSEGPLYLEKIVQVSFDMPEPSETRIQKVLSCQLGSL